MYLIPEQDAAEAVSLEAVVPLMESAFVALAKGEVELLPVAIAAGFSPDAAFGAKGAIVRSMGLFGFKLGSYWPTNAARGLPGHGSMTILNDPDSGFPMALIGAKHISAVRTAALDAIAMRLLSRPDSKTLAIIGAGRQGWQEYLAARLVRPIARVLVWSRSPAAAQAFADRISAHHGLAAEVASIEGAVRAADIVITATASSLPLVERAWVRAGTHISALGADTTAKLELAVDLVASAKLYADVVEQSVTIGEFKAALASGLIRREDITPIGSIMQCAGPIRLESDVTVFDSSGTALQDLVIAKLVLDAVLASGRVTEVEL